MRKKYKGYLIINFKLKKKITKHNKNVSDKKLFNRLYLSKFIFIIGLDYITISSFNLKNIIKVTKRFPSIL